MVLELDFKATVEDCDIENINKYLGVSKDVDIDTGKPTAYINYELQPESRSWGLKGIYIFIRDVACSIEWEVVMDDDIMKEKEALIKAGGREFGNGTIGGTIEIDARNDGWEMDDSEIEFETDGALSIDNVSIDLFYKKITIS